jgi:hypothetical protein
MTIWFTRIYDRHVRVYVDHAFDAETAKYAGLGRVPLVSGVAFCGEVFSNKPVTSQTRPSLPVCERCYSQIGTIFRVAQG